MPDCNGFACYANDFLSVVSLHSVTLSFVVGWWGFRALARRIIHP